MKFDKRFSEVKKEEYGFIWLGRRRNDRPFPLF